MKFRLLLLALALATVFQNCGRINSKSGTGGQDSKSDSGLRGNGDSYSGKPYNNYLDSGLCADESPVKATILVNREHYFQTRANCQPLAEPIEISASEIDTAAMPTSFSHKGEVYLDAGLTHKNSPQGKSNTVTVCGSFYPANAVHEEGFNYILQFFTKEGDTLGDNNFSKIVILEDGQPLGPAHSLHADIRSLGGGRFSHWNTSLYFSTSDNSDPRGNKRTYTYGVTSGSCPAEIATLTETPAQTVSLPPPAATVDPLSLVTASTNDGLMDWPAQNILDTDANSCYSSAAYGAEYDSVHNGITLAAWFAGPADISVVQLQARTNNGAVQGFPSRYRVYLTKPDNSAWDYVGEYSDQPNSSGLLNISVGNRRTYGVMIIPDTLGVDGYGVHYFQLCGIRLF